MKNILVIIIIFLNFQCINAQQHFTKTENFSVIIETTDEAKMHAPFVINLVAKGDDLKKISTLRIEDTELFEDIFVTSLKNPGLEGVSEIIKMEVEYLGCCAHVEAYYYMIKNDNTIVPLPELKNIYCENSNIDFQYIFPNQEYGEKGNILEAQAFYIEKVNDIKDVDLKKSFAWNNGRIQDSNSITIASN